MSLPMDPDLIDVVVLSHQHPDHCVDALAAYHAWTFRPNPREAVPLLAPQSVWDRLTEFIDKDPECFDFQPVGTGDEATFGELHVSFVAMDHSVPTVGSRWEANNRSLFYTADTGPGGDWADSAAGVDVLLSEASYQEATKDQDYPQHLSAAEAGEIGRRMGVGRLVLTHIPPYLDVAVSVTEAEAVFGRPVHLAVAATSFDV
jgi:ribonuclease BN (tRNA processing enzyme)